MAECSKEKIVQVAVLGTGILGACISERLLKSGQDVVVYNRTRAKALLLQSSGARIAANPKEAIERSSVVLLILSDAAAVENVLFEDESIDFQGRTIIQMSTIAPEQSRSIQKRVEGQGAEYLECPVLGSRPETRAGELILLVGGTRDQFDQWQAFLRILGPHPRLVGPVGQAAALKLSLNQLIASLAAIFSLSLGMVQREGVDVELFMEILRDSALYAKTFDKKLPRMLARDFSDPNFPVKHLLKDIELVLNEAVSCGLSVEILRGVKALISKGIEQGLGEEDYSAIYNVINPQEKE